MKEISERFRRGTAVFRMGHTPEEIELAGETRSQKNRNATILI
jgi:hypothetical protein